MTFTVGRMPRIACGVVLLSLVAAAVVAQQKVANRYVPADQLPWYKESPELPVELASLWGNRAQQEAGTLLRTPPGFDSGLHSHTADYWAVVVQGTWKHWVPSTGEGVGLTLEPGAHWTQVRTQLHQDACISKVPCVIFLFNKDPYVTEFPQPSITVPIEKMSWRKQAPDLPQRITMLWGDRDRDGGFGELVELPPGFRSPLHAHSGDFHGVLIKGSWLHEDASGRGTPVAPGSYVRQQGGEMHVDRCVSKEPCVLFLFQDSRADVILPK